MDAAGERPVPRLMLVADPRRTTLPLPRLVAAAIGGGVDGVRLVPPDGSRREQAAMVEELRAIAAGRASLVVDGDAAQAAALGLGLHLPEAGPATAAARGRLGDAALLGRTVSSAAAAAAALGADYLVAAPVFVAGEQGGTAIGVDGLGRIVDATWSPVLAEGGVTVAEVARVLNAGAHGVVVGEAIAAAADPERAAAALRAAIEATAPSEGTPPPPAAVGIVVDGVPTEVEPETTVTDLLLDAGRAAGTVSVRLNGKALARRSFDETTLAAGDRVEVGRR